MKYTCKYCGGIHEEGYKCPRKPKRQYKPRPDTDRGNFRVSSEWLRVRAEVLERDGYRCRICEEEHTPRRYNRRLSVHHIVPLAEDWTRRSDPDNLITLCDRHHDDAERGRYSRTYLKKLVKASPRG